MSYKFGSQSLANLAKCHPALQALATRALALSPVDFSIIRGAGLALTMAPYPPDNDPAKYLAIANAFWQAAWEQETNLTRCGLINTAPNLLSAGDSPELARVEIVEPAGGQRPASSPTAAPVPAGSIANGGPAYEKLIAWLKAEEGLVLKGHWDRIGKVWDIGHGYNLTAHGVPDSEARNLVWTPEQADRALRAEVASTIAELEAHWPRWDDDFDAVRQAVFISGVYQLGVGSAAKFRNTIACLRAHDFEGAVHNLEASQWARQTPNRVGRIEQMLLTGQWPAEVNGVRL